MRLRRLELQGFKSFLDRTILTFEPGITGVVGPNGCGKSNIVDAIQWVMGEQSAKHLRGDTMTDVIFNGSDTKAATSMAEVSLVLDRQGVALAPQFSAFDKSDEISITRRVYRDGSSEYLINKTNCRLKDIHELFMDTGVGKRAYSIIEQGQIDRMVSVKPEDRRYIFEEVAGITKYKAKRKEAERKLEATRQNMQRLQDIIVELEKQIRSLKIQATKARKFKELKAELEAVDLYLLGRNLFQHRENLESLKARKEELSLKRSEMDASTGMLEAELTASELKKIELERQYHDLDQRHHDLVLKIQRFEGEQSLVGERSKHLDETMSEAQSQLDDVQVELSSLQDEITKELTHLDALTSEIDGMADTIQAQTSEWDQAQREWRAAIQSKDSLSNSISELAQKEVVLENQSQHLNQKQSDCLSLQDEQNQKLTEIVVSLAAQKELSESVDQKILEVQSRASQAESDVSSAGSECQELSMRLSTLEDTLYERRELFHQRRSRMESLQDLQKNLEGYAPTAREVLLKLEDVGSAVLLGEVLRPDTDIEEHLEVLLGDELNTIIVNTTEEAEKLSTRIVENNMERVRILPLSELSKVSNSFSENPISGLAMMDKVRATPGYEAIVRHYFGQCFLMEDVSTVLSIRQGHSQQTLVTVDGKLASHSDHTITTGIVPAKIGVFSRRREVEELTEECQSLSVEVQRCTTERENLLTQLQNQERLHDELKTKLSSLHIEKVEYRKERERVSEILTRTENEYVALQKRSEINLTALNEVRARQEQLVTQLSQVREHKLSRTQELEGLADRIQALSEAQQVCGARAQETKIKLSGLTEQERLGRSRQEERQEQVFELQNKSHSMQTKIQAGGIEKAKLAEELVGIEQRRAEAEQTQLAMQVEIDAAQKAFEEICHSVQGLKEKVQSLQSERHEIMDAFQQTEVQWTQEQSHWEHLRAIAEERYHAEPTLVDAEMAFDLSKTPLFFSQVETTWGNLIDDDRFRLLEEHLQNVKEKVSRYGEVNLTAIHEFDEIQKRYDFLMEQRTDLEKAIQILEEAIQKIDDSTKTRFKETFDAVNEKFVEIFPILFNGGKAELIMTANENVLDAGVEIMAQPPGKRLQSITLLSGGEKALTAVSLVLAIFARKPSPFCLLDEVDAPLDDANVSRFNTVIKKMSEKTQFIVITHNKKTMEIAEGLYGVTMERAGISKMTSVRLQ